MTAFLEAVGTCLWALVFLRALTHADRLIALGERAMTLVENRMPKGIESRLTKLIGKK